nr:unnamed protein product [Digitaria exilis]
MQQQHAANGMRTCLPWGQGAPSRRCVESRRPRYHPTVNAHLLPYSVSTHHHYSSSSSARPLPPPIGDQVLPDRQCSRAYTAALRPPLKPPAIGSKNPRNTNRRHVDYHPAGDDLAAGRSTYRPPGCGGYSA